MKTILITGVNRGLGKELFNLFISKGYNVFGVLRNKHEAEKLKRGLSKNAKIILTDLSSDESIESIQEVVKDHPVDLLINNAGISGNSSSIDEIESEEILRLINIHCLGAFRATKAIKANLLKTKNPVVINLNSRLGSITRQSKGTYKHLAISYSYRIAKAAQNMLTNCFKNEFNGSIKFISVHPGKMKTEIASEDADVEAIDIANKILNAFENKELREENGIIELGEQLIEW